jgi:hypothetical protein
VFTAIRTPRTAALTATVVAVMLAVGIFWRQPNPETSTAELQPARHSSMPFVAFQPNQKSTGALKLAQFRGHEDKPERESFSLSPGACRIVHDAEGNTEGHCDLSRVGTPALDAGQSPFGPMK